MAGNTDIKLIIMESSRVELGFPGGSVIKNPPVNAGDTGDAGSIPGSRKSFGGRIGNPTPVFLPGKSHGQRILVGYSPSIESHRAGHNLATEHTHRAELPKCKFFYFVS